MNQRVSRDDIPGIQYDDISRHNRFDWNFLGASITKHRSLNLHHGQQLLHGVVCAVLLPKPEQAAYEDNGENNESVNRIM